MNVIMKLNKLILTNFRQFKNFEIDFSDIMTIIGGYSDIGKTSILDAIRIILSPFLSAFDFGKRCDFSSNDIRLYYNKDKSEATQIYPLRIEAKLSIFEDIIFREILIPKNKNNIKNTRQLVNYGKDLNKKVSNLEKINLPVIAYYGTERLWKPYKDIRRSAMLSASRSMGYKDCFISNSNFIQVQQWIIKAFFSCLQKQEMKKIYASSNIDEQLRGIEETISYFINLDDICHLGFCYKCRELFFKNKEINELLISNLEVGILDLFSIVIDLAWRCVKLNPHLGNQAQQKTEGIVLIDEIDKDVIILNNIFLNKFKKYFPKIQFIITVKDKSIFSHLNNKHTISLN